MLCLRRLNDLPGQTRAAHWDSGDCNLPRARLVPLQPLFTMIRSPVRLEMLSLLALSLVLSSQICRQVPRHGKGSVRVRLELSSCCVHSRLKRLEGLFLAG